MPLESRLVTDRMPLQVGLGPIQTPSSAFFNTSRQPPLGGGRSKAEEMESKRVTLTAVSADRLGLPPMTQGVDTTSSQHSCAATIIVLVLLVLPGSPCRERYSSCR